MKMADIELVIKISEKVYNALSHTEFDANLVVGEMRKSIANGTTMVRCKDCKHTKTDGCDAIYCEKWDYWEIPEDFYCAYGERRENA